MTPLSGSFPEFSPYIYCGGDPINRADPTGAKIEDPYISILTTELRYVSKLMIGTIVPKNLRCSDMLELINRLIL